VGQRGNYVGYLTPAVGTFKRFEIDPDSHPHNLVITGNAQVWYTGNTNGTINRLDPANGRITRYPLPEDLKDPHTLAPDARGHLWFTVQNGNAVGRLALPSGSIRITRLPTPGSRPYGIAIDSAGRPWFAEFGGNRIGTIEPNTLALREYTLPDSGSRPRRIALTSDGRVWVDDYPRGMLIRLDPGTGRVQEWPAPSGRRSLPYAMAVDDQDRIWLVETGVQPNQLVGFDTRNLRFFGSAPILPSGGGTVRHMVFDQTDGVLWFGTDANTIGRAQLR
jgi:virginiamycin B lyase